MIRYTGVDKHMLPKLTPFRKCTSALGTNMISYLFMDTFLFRNFDFFYHVMCLSRLSRFWYLYILKLHKRSKYHSSCTFRFFRLVNGRPPSPLGQSSKRQNQAVFLILPFVSELKYSGLKSSSSCEGSDVDSVSFTTSTVAGSIFGRLILDAFLAVRLLDRLLARRVLLLVLMCV